MKNIILFSVFCFYGLSASAGQLPCGGKKGRVIACSERGDFICADQTTSQSKRVCVSQSNRDNQEVVYRRRYNEALYFDEWNQNKWVDDNKW